MYLLLVVPVVNTMSFGSCKPVLEYIIEVDLVVTFSLFMYLKYNTSHFIQYAYTTEHRQYI